MGGAVATRPAGRDGTGATVTVRSRPTGVLISATVAVGARTARVGAGPTRGGPLLVAVTTGGATGGAGGAVELGRGAGRPTAVAGRAAVTTGAVAVGRRVGAVTGEGRAVTLPGLAGGRGEATTTTGRRVGLASAKIVLPVRMAGGWPGAGVGGRRVSAPVAVPGRRVGPSATVPARVGAGIVALTAGGGETSTRPPPTGVVALVRGGPAPGVVEGGASATRVPTGCSVPPAVEDGASATRVPARSGVPGVPTVAMMIVGPGKAAAGAGVGVAPRTSTGTELLGSTSSASRRTEASYEPAAA